MCLFVYTFYCNILAYCFLFFRNGCCCWSDHHFIPPSGRKHLTWTLLINCLLRKQFVLVRTFSDVWTHPLSSHTRYDHQAPSKQAVHHLTSQGCCYVVRDSSHSITTILISFFCGHIRIDWLIDCDHSFTIIVKVSGVGGRAWSFDFFLLYIKVKRKSKWFFRHAHHVHDDEN